MKIDLRSDTVTLPTAGMLDAMMHARVGDDVFGEDPTVRELETKLARLFGKEDGIFCPSGTMTNQIAIRMHTRPGDEVICHKESHVYRYEAGGIAANSHASVRLIEGNRGRLTAADICENVNNADDVHFPVTRLVCVEDTVNRGGGAIYDFDEIRKIRGACDQFHLALHLDGARLFNSLAETRMNPVDYAKPFDTISTCLSKGLGAPVGSVLLGSNAQIKEARRLRKLMGGAMRQAGYLAAAGIYALDHHVERLRDDHRRAKLIGAMAKECSYIQEVFPVETNIVILMLKSAAAAEAFLAHLGEHDILAISFGGPLVRMVTHLGINDDMLEKLRGALNRFHAQKVIVRGAAP